MKDPKYGERPFKYTSAGGTRFTCRCDFRGGVKVENAQENKLDFAADVAEMAVYHAMNIWPNLNGFQGYDTITFNE